MKIFSPKNIFTSILLESLPKDCGIEVQFTEAALACKKLEEDTSAVALMPSLELLNHQTLFVSSKFGISFDGALSNSMLHFFKSQRSLEKIFLRGDVSLNEIILTKILFSERYSTEIEINLETSSLPTGNKHYIIVGDENLRLWKSEEGISLSDEIADMLDFPYVNFVLASQDRESIATINKILEQSNRNTEEHIESIFSQLNYPQETVLFVKNNLDSVFFDLTENEEDAVNELIKLIYYRGLTDDMFDVKFV
jgi:predicted solute-binding protein